MGIIDDIIDKFDDKTSGADKVKGGFDADVCAGNVPEYNTECPYRGDAPLKPCDLCGCPTIRNGGLDLTNRTPEGCPREREHKDRG